MSDLVRLLVCIALALCGLVGRSSAQQGEAPVAQAPKRVLFLSSFGYGRPGGYTSSFVSTLQAGGLGLENVMVEFLDLNRLDPDTRARKRELLLRQYDSRNVDLIVTFQQPALNLLLDDLKDLAPRAPVVVSNATVPPRASTSGRRFLQQTVALDFKGTLALALDLFPDTRRVVFMSGAGEQDLASKREFQLATVPWHHKLAFEYTDHLTAGEMLQRVSRLPPHTVVIRSYTNQDRTGQRFVPTEFAAKVHKAANAPVFTLYDVTVGRGAIGGSVFHLEHEARRAALEALAILNGGRQLTEPVTHLSPQFVPMFDWAQIERWGGDARHLPPGTVFVNRPPTLWSEHRGTVIGVLAVFVLLAALSAALLVQNRRRRRAEDEVRGLNAELERRVHERTLQLEQSNAELAGSRDEAAAANVAKSEFLANMSHEIRTPMNAILGMTDLALRGELTARQRDYLGRARDAEHSLLGIINDILDFSKMEAGKLDMESREFSLDEVLEKVSSVVGVEARRKGLDLVMHTAPDVARSLVGDPLRLGQVLINLCTNAVKFTQRGRVVVTATMQAATAPDHVLLRFSVRDTGTGIDAQQLERLFHPFSQLDASSTRRHGGTGLGLAICRQLVQLMGGEIGVASQPGIGSDFHFSACFGRGSALPRPRDAKHTTLPVDEKLLATIRGRRVLLAEDNETNQLLAVALLQDMGGACVTIARDGQEAVDMARSQPFDVVLMDVQMPVMDGCEAAMSIRQFAPSRSLPIIAMTALAMVSDKEKCLRAGMNDYVTKPFAPDELFTVLAKWMPREVESS